MKKILVLSMSCNEEFFLKEERLCLDTWAKCILDKDNISLVFYTSSKDGRWHIHKNKIEVPSSDDLRGTIQKTVMALKIVRHLGIQYDYILRTNTSTYINISLLDEFIQLLYNDDYIYAPMVFMSEIDIWPQGNGIIMSKKFVNYILDNVGKSLKLYREWYQNEVLDHDFNDDNFIGMMFSLFCIENNLSIVNCQKQYGIAGTSWFSFTPDFSVLRYNVNDYIALSYRSKNQEYDKREEEFLTCNAIHKQINTHNADLKYITEYLNDDFVVVARDHKFIVSLKSSVNFNDFRIDEKASHISNVMQ